MGYKIIVADDHKIIYEGLRMLIISKIPQATVEGVTDLPELENRIEEVDFDLIILDVNLPGASVRQFVKLHSSSSKTPIIIFSGYEERVFATAFIKSGAWGYVEKGAAPNTILDAIQSVLNGKKYVSGNVKDILVDLGISSLANEPTSTLQPDSLSPREFEVARMMVAGSSVKVIALKLGLSQSAVGTYKKRIFNKLGINNILELSRLYEKGSIDEFE